MAKIAFIGLGNMGGPMAANLAKAQHHVVAFDLSAAALDAAVEKGAHKAASAADAVKGAEVVVTMLPAGKHVREVYEKDVLPNVAKGTLLIDCSTIDVDSAIVDSASTAARPDLPGGLKHRIVLEPADGANSTSDSFNLASTRVVDIPSAGTRTYYFRITPRQMTPGTKCFVYNAAFSVVFVRLPETFEIRSKAPCTTSSHWCDAFAENDAVTLFVCVAARCPVLEVNALDAARVRIDPGHGVRAGFHAGAHVKL